MSVIYANPTKQSRMDAVISDIGAAGKLKIFTAADALLATLVFPNPAGVASGAVLTFDFDPDISTTATGTGTAAKASITNSADGDVITGLTVGLAGTDVILDSLNITIGQTVLVTIGSITHAA